MHKPAMLPAARQVPEANPQLSNLCLVLEPHRRHIEQPGLRRARRSRLDAGQIQQAQQACVSAAAPPVPWPHFRALRGRHSVVPPRRPAFGRHPPQIPQRYGDMDVRVSDHHPEGPGLVSGASLDSRPVDQSAKECALWNGGLLQRSSSQVLSSTTRYEVEALQQPVIRHLPLELLERPAAPGGENPELVGESPAEGAGASPYEWLPVIDAQIRPGGELTASRPSRRSGRPALSPPLSTGMLPGRQPCRGAS